jgi:hypothetical protein
MTESTSKACQKEDPWISHALDSSNCDFLKQFMDLSMSTSRSASSPQPPLSVGLSTSTSRSASSPQPPLSVGLSTSTPISASSLQPPTSVLLSASTPISAPSQQPSTSDDLCVICFSEKSCYAMVPCGHLLMCEYCKCYYCKIEPIKCYICQRLVHKMIKISNV